MIRERKEKMRRRSFGRGADIFRCTLLRRPRGLERAMGEKKINTSYPPLSFTNGAMPTSSTSLK